MFKAFFWFCGRCNTGDLPGTRYLKTYLDVPYFETPLRIEIGEFGVAHVWFQWYEKGYFQKMPKTLL